MMHCIAVDDEKLALDLLEDNIKQIPFLKLVKRCKNAMEAMDVLKRERVDLMFLDIQMAGVTGFQLLKSLSVKPLTIMITAYDNYAVEGFNLDVVDYLVKPVSFERFLKACNKAYDLYQLQHRQLFSNSIIQRDYFFVNVEYNQVRINNDDIVFVEAMKDYIRIHLANAKPVLTRMSMKAMEEKLPVHQFARIHKSYIVSLPKISAIKRGLVVVAQHEIPLSDNYKANLEALLGLQPE